MILCFFIIECGTKQITKNATTKKSIPASETQKLPSAQKPMTLADASSSAKPSAEKPKAPAQPAAKQTATTRSIKVKNNISHDMLGYRKFGMHYPKEFKIFIEGKELKENQMVTTKIQNNVLPIVFHYDFGYSYKGRGKGKRCSTFKIPPTNQEVVLAFNWKTDSQVLIQNIKEADFVKLEDLV
jgi:hypothetical protein